MENKQLTNRELDKWLAEKVMGWKMFAYVGVKWYIDAENMKGSAADDWHPTEDIKQAFECLNAIHELNLDERIDYVEGGYLVWLYNNETEIPAVIPEEGIKDLPLAICQAIYKALTAGD